MALRKPNSMIQREGALDILQGIKTTWEDARQVILKQRELQKKYETRSVGKRSTSRGDLVNAEYREPDGWARQAQRSLRRAFRVAEVRENGVNGDSSCQRSLPPAPRSMSRS